MVSLRFTRPRDWPAIHQSRTTPPPADPGDIVTWIHCQAAPTGQFAAISKALDGVLRSHCGTNERWLAISGEPHLGKTHAITSLLLRRAMNDKRGWFSRGKSGHLHVPYVYVTAAPDGQARGLLASIAEFCGIPSAGQKEQDLLALLDRLLPTLGTKAVVVDDANNYRRASANASRLTDGLRNVIHLPVPLVFVGVDLHRSALLLDPGRNNDTVQQLARRNTMLRLFALRGVGDEGEAKRFIVGMAKRLRLIDSLDLRGLQDAAALARLLALCEGRPGSVLETLQNAAVAAVTEDSVLSGDRLIDAWEQRFGSERAATAEARS